MTQLDTIIERLRILFVETFHVEPPSPDVDLLESGILDSLQFVEMLAQLEQRFDYRISIEAIDLDDLRTLESIARMVGTRGAAVASTSAHGIA
jgi:D-alanine--poly(phosphoribitol) ligase subunit 2